MLLGKWESFKFVYKQEYPGAHGNNYFVSKVFYADSIPYILTLELTENSWNVYSDNSLLCGEKFNNVVVHQFGSQYNIYLGKNNKNPFVISYSNSEIYFMSHYLENHYSFDKFYTIYLKRIN